MGHDMVFEKRGVGDHLVEIGPGKDHLGRRIRQDSEDLIKIRLHVFAELAHLLRMIIHLQIELRRIQELFHDMVPGTGGEVGKGRGKAFISHFFLVLQIIAIIRMNFDVFENVPYDLIIPGLLEDRLGDPGDGGPRPLHFIGIQDFAGHGPQGGLEQRPLIQIKMENP